MAGIEIAAAAVDCCGRDLNSPVAAGSAEACAAGAVCGGIAGWGAGCGGTAATAPVVAVAVAAAPVTSGSWVALVRVPAGSPTAAPAGAARSWVGALAAAAGGVPALVR
jgi:hypothetical protein